MVEFILEGNRVSVSAPEPGLYLVATPIGNLSDITIRALKILAGCDVIACEDTRVTGKLLKHFSILTRMLPYHEHNAAKSGPKILSLLAEGKSVALVSDAGMPLISDPGYRLIDTVTQEEHRIIPVPGASSTLTALIASGLPTDSFMFTGFLPSKSKAREKRLEELAQYPETLILFESPNRLIACIETMANIFGSERRISIARELTKLHEEFISGTIHEVLAKLDGRSIKGEIVIVVEGAREGSKVDTAQLLTELLKTMSVSRAASEAAQLTGQAKRELYQMALKISENADV